VEEEEPLVPWIVQRRSIVPQSLAAVRACHSETWDFLKRLIPTLQRIDEPANTVEEVRSIGENLALPDLSERCEPFMCRRTRELKDLLLSFRLLPRPGLTMTGERCLQMPNIGTEVVKESALLSRKVTLFQLAELE
jgi:hypothetical protein